jgi:Xaa-Pro aminopeptidase
VKRGLVVRDPAEIADAEWSSRVAALQSALAEAGVDVGLIYNDVSRGDDVGYLTNLCIYWNEGVLAVPVTGEPSLLTKLSKRVHTWMRKTSTLTDIRSGKAFGGLVSAYVEGRAQGVLGIVDADLWPASLVEEISGALPGWRVVPLGPLVRDRRALPSPAELALLNEGAAVLRDALAEAAAVGMRMHERLAAIDRVARHGGFADVLVRGSETAGHATIDLAGEYRHNWLLAARTFGDDASPDVLTAAQAAVLAALEPGTPWSDIEAAAEPALAGLPDDCLTSVRWINQADFATGGELRPPAGAGPSDGEVGAVVIEAIDPAGRRSVLTDTVHVTAGGAVPLTVVRRPEGEAHA